METVGPEFGKRPLELMECSTDMLLQLTEALYEYPDMLLLIWREAVERKTLAAKVLGSMLRLKLKADPGFVWPGTEPLDSRSPLPAIDAPTEGPLSLMGYRVGKNGRSQLDRRALLAMAFSGDVPVVGTSEDAAKWGKPNTCQRLRKIADSLASFARNAKQRNSSALAVAIGHWESDLEWMRVNYHRGRCDFTWPRTNG